VTDILKSDFSLFSQGIIGAIIKGYTGSVSSQIIANIFANNPWLKGAFDYNLKQQLPSTIFGLLTTPYYGPQ
jgi:hypothetical protein